MLFDAEMVRVHILPHLLELQTRPDVDKSAVTAACAKAAASHFASTAFGNQLMGALKTAGVMKLAPHDMERVYASLIGDIELRPMTDGATRLLMAITRVVCKRVGSGS